MYKTIRKQVRPNLSVDFWQARTNEAVTEEAMQHMQQSYIDTRKMLSKESELSENGLEQITTTIWDSMQSFQEFVNDPIIKLEVIALADAYTAQNGIEAQQVFSGEV